MAAQKPLLLLAAVALLVATANCLSIEREPVRVTHQNSGPKYEVDDVDKQPIANSPQNDDDASNDIYLKRSYHANSDLFPVLGSPFSRPASPMSARRPLFTSMRNSAEDSDTSESDNGENFQPLFAVRRFIIFSPRKSDDEQPSASGAAAAAAASNQDPKTPAFARPPFMSESEPSSMMGNPFFRFRFSEQPESLSSSESSNSPADPKQQQQPPMIPDPFHVMMELLHKVLEARVNATHGDSPFSGLQPAKDLNIDESAAASNNNDKNAVQPVKPIDTEETTSEIVDFEGEKFVKKTTIKKHINHGVYFVTKKLSFVPLNETEQSTTTKPAPSTPVTTELTNSSTNKIDTTEKPTTTVATPTSTASISTSASTSVSTSASTSASTTPKTQTTTAASTTEEARTTPTQTSLEKEGEPTNKEAVAPSQSEPMKLSQ